MESNEQSIQDAQDRFNAEIEKAKGEFEANFENAFKASFEDAFRVENDEATEEFNANIEAAFAGLNPTLDETGIAVKK